MPAQHAGPPTPFAFFTCQVGAEGALKAELARFRPDWRLAFSRPGFLTFKAPGETAETLRSLALPTFARAGGESLGKVGGQSPDQLAANVRQLVAPREFDRLHVWQRDAAPPGRHGFEPSPTALARETGASLLAALAGDARSPASASSADAAGGAAVASLPDAATAAEVAVAGQRVLDCVIVEPDEWWIGRHDAGDDPASCWVGGVPAIDTPAEIISRAYLKMEEALRWSRLPCRAGERWAEIGCAPGGASQALLDRGMIVLGIDPAEVDPRLAAHPRFTQMRMRAADARRREFRNIRWLAADINVAPDYTLDAVEGIVGHAAADVEGLLLTLKLPDWSLAERIPDYIERIRAWGYTRIQTRQLAFNRQEVCVAATRPSRPRPAEHRRAAKRSVPRRLKRRRKRLE